jgi:DNA-binding protein YbaB
MKKVLSLVLVIAMVLSSMSFAFASPMTDVSGSDYEDAINALVALGVVSGYEDGTFKAEKTITRAEMAKLMVITLGYGDLVAGSKSNFSDTQGHWADAYIALAAGKGIVVGTGNGKFSPDRTVSYDEVYTMLVRGLGYTDTCNELKGMTWPTNFKVKAAELGITKDVVMATTGADRGGVVQAIYNALEATLVTVNTDGDVVNILDKSKNGVDLLSRMADLNENFTVTENVLDPGNKDYAGNFVNLEPYMFQNLDVYQNDDDEVVYIKESNSLTFEGEVDDLVVNGTGLDFTVIDENDKTQKYTFKSTTLTDSIVSDKLFVNGEMKEVTGLYSDLLDADYVKVVANETISATDNGKIDMGEITGYVIDTQTRVGRVEKAYVDGKAKLDVFDLPVDSDDKLDMTQVKVEGAATSLEDIKVDDVVVEYAAFDSDNEVLQTRLVVARNSVEGKVTRVDGSKFYVDGTKYSLNGSKGSVTKVDLDLGDEGTFYLDHNGKIADYDGESAGPTDYAVVIGVADGTITNKFSTKSIDDYPQIKLATQANEIVTYDIQVKMDSNGTISNSAKVGGNAIVGANLSVSGISAGQLVKYSLNSDGKINKITIETAGDLRTTSSSIYSEVDLDLAKNALASNAVIFDATDDDEDFNVVKESSLPSKLKANITRNSKGEIVVLVAMTGEISTGADTIYAYINKVNKAYDSKGDEVQLVVLYTDGQKKEILTDSTGVFALGTINRAYSFKYDDAVIDTGAASATASVATATSINAKGSMIKLNVGTAGANAAVGEGWFALSDHATIVGVDKTDDYSVNAIRDLYDIDENDSIKVYFNTDKEIDLIVIEE